MNERPDKGKMETKNRNGKLETLELSLFCHQVSLVIKSGIHPIEGIPLIAEEMVNPYMRQALLEAGDAVVKGTPVYQALADTGAFPEYLIAMTRLGESAGMLEQVMERLSAFYEKEDRMAKRIRSALTYPLLLLVLMLGVIVLLVSQVLPMFAGILASLGGELPSATRFLLGAGAFLSTWGLWILLLLAAIGFAFYLRTRSEKGRLAWDGMKLKTPLFGKLFVKSAAARFSAGLSVVLQSGMELQEGLEQVQSLTENRRVRSMISVVREQVASGADLGTALGSVALFPPLFARMMQIGQRTGELDKMMDKISSLYEGEVEQTSKQLSNAIEPVLILILSVVVGIVLLAVMLPLINIMGTIG